MFVADCLFDLVMAGCKFVLVLFWYFGGAYCVMVCYFFCGFMLIVCLRFALLYC